MAWFSLLVTAVVFLGCAVASPILLIPTVATPRMTFGLGLALVLFA